MDQDDKDRLAGFQTYIDGKMKRYNLLFAVNGGALAIAKLITDGHAGVGGLSLPAVAVGAISFTVLMTLDIYLWGQMMRNSFLDRKAFGTPGKAILLCLGVLLILGWVLAAWG